MGLVYRHDGEPEKARAEFLEDAALEPSVAFNYDQLGLLANAEGKDKEASSYFERAVKEDARLGTSWFGLAKIYRAEKRYAEALRALDKAGAIDAKSASVHYLRAEVLGAMGRRDEAQKEMAEVQRLKKEGVDQLEREISGATYRDREVVK